MGKDAGFWRAVDFTRAAWVCLLLASASASGADVGLAGLFPGKALLTINGGPPRIVALGARTDEGVRVLAIDGETATTRSRRQEAVAAGRPERRRAAVGRRSGDGHPDR